MIQFIKKNLMRLWISALAGMGTGMFIELFVGIWYAPSISAYIMLPLIIGTAIGYWFILANNNNFNKF